MPNLLPTQAVFVEERYLASIFYARLRQVCATKATIAHVDVSQKFQAYVTNNENAQDDVDTVFKLLNDDGKGLVALQNTAVGYRLSNSANILRKMSNLPTDLLNIDPATPVDMPARFNEVFVDAQLNLENRPTPTGNTLLDMIRDLTHLRLVIIGIRNFVEHALEANAQSVYSIKTKAKYDALKLELMKLFDDAVNKIGKSAKIIEPYANPADMPAIGAIVEDVRNKATILDLEVTMSNPHYGNDLKVLDGVWNLDQIVNRETILILTGSRIEAELLDRPVAEMLRDEIDKLGKGVPFRRGIVISDLSWQQSETYKNYPLIAIGGPNTNEKTKHILTKTEPKNVNGFYSAFVQERFPNIAVWGGLASECRDSAIYFIKMGLRDFLNKCWK